LTIDADSRPVGAEAVASDFNGIRIKSDSSRGGLVNDISFKDVCMRDMTNAILISTAYNPLFAGTAYPDFRALSFQDVHHVSCMGLRQPVITLNGFNAALQAGPITLDNVVVDNLGPSAWLAIRGHSPGSRRRQLRAFRHRRHRHQSNYGRARAETLRVPDVARAASAGGLASVSHGR